MLPLPVVRLPALHEATDCGRRQSGGTSMLLTFTYWPERSRTFGTLTSTSPNPVWILRSGRYPLRTKARFPSTVYPACCASSSSPSFSSSPKASPAGAFSSTTADSSTAVYVSCWLLIRQNQSTGYTDRSVSPYIRNQHSYTKSASIFAGISPT